MTLDDGIYSKQSALLRAPGSSRDRHADDELDITGTWKASRHWRVIAGGGVVTPGAFLSNTTGRAHTERWGFLGTTFTF